LKKIWFFGVKSWFFTRNTPKMFAPPSVRRNFFKCPPLTWNRGSAPGINPPTCHKWLTNFIEYTSLWSALKLTTTLVILCTFMYSWLQKIYIVKCFKYVHCLTFKRTFSVSDTNCLSSIMIWVMLWILMPLVNHFVVISWRSVLLDEETGVYHRPVASHWQTIQCQFLYVPYLFQYWYVERLSGC